VGTFLSPGSGQGVHMSKSGDSKNTLYCSFCGKSQHEVRKLIAGPTCSFATNALNCAWTSSGRSIRLTW